MPGNDRRSRRRARRCRKLGGQIERPFDHAERLLGKLVLLKLGLRVKNVLRSQRAGFPCQLQRDQILVGRRVAVRVETLVERGRQLQVGRAAALNGDLLRLGNRDLRTLREQDRREKQ